MRGGRISAAYDAVRANTEHHGLLTTYILRTHSSFERYLFYLLRCAILHLRAVRHIAAACLSDYVDGVTKAHRDEANCFAVALSKVHAMLAAR